MKQLFMVFMLILYVSAMGQFTLEGGDAVAWNGTALYMVEGYSADLYIHLVNFTVNTTCYLHMPAKIEAFTVNSSDVALDLGLEENQTVGLVVFYYPDNSTLHLYIYPHEDSTWSIPEIRQLFNPSYIVTWFQGWWGGGAFTVLMLLPVSIYLKSRSIGLFGVSMAIVGGLSVVAFPDPWGKMGLLALAVAIAAILYKLVWGD